LRQAGKISESSRPDMSTRYYLDYNATTPLRPEVREAVIEALGIVGNPSSVHAEGRLARAEVETARAKIAALAGAAPESVIFTSGGTEANALALAPNEQQKWCCLISGIEHPSVASGGRFQTDSVVPIPALAGGTVDLEALETAVSEHHLMGRRIFASVMLANNETGALQPVKEATEIVHGADGILHTDAVQAAGKVPIDMEALGVDMLSLSAHKFGGPKGVGALMVRPGIPVAPLLKGGGQESRRRAGTENVAGLVGFGVAAELARNELETSRARLAALRDELEGQVAAIRPDARVVCRDVERLPNTSCIAVPGTKAETLVIGLDLAGIAVSAGSACSSGKVEPSHVLAAMGLEPELAESVIRVSLGWDTAPADIGRFIGAWSDLIGRMKDNRAAA
jgi:cysteine desulfurase